MVAPQGAAGQGQSIETLYVDIAARADRLIQEAEEAVTQVVGHLNRLEEKNKEVEKSFGRLGKFMKTALAVGTGMFLARIGGSMINAVMNFGRSMIQANAQMQTFVQSFTVLTGSAEEAGEIIEWVKEQAKATPFDVPGLIQASQMLMTWGLDLKEWFTIVGDVAAGMNRPLSQVVNAIGTLATGQTGEAVRRFRDLGINLREFAGEGLEFDARGALITPLEEVIPIVKQIMQDKFGGMMDAQAKTWAGVMSNMGDIWQEFVRQVGEPLFEQLNAALFEMFNWLEDNEALISGIAQGIGEALGGVLGLLMEVLGGFGRIAEIIDDIIVSLTGMPNWMQEGIAAGRQVAAIGGGAVVGAAEFWGAALRGEDIEEAAYIAQNAWLETMLSIAGEVDNLEVNLDEMTEAHQAGIQGVIDKWGLAFGMAEDAAEATEEQQEKMFEWAMAGKAAETMEGVYIILESIGIAAPGVTEEWRKQTFAVREVEKAYSEAKKEFEDTERRLKAIQDALAAQRAELKALMEVASEVATKFTKKIQDAFDRYEERVAKLRAKTAEAIAALQAEADQAVLEATQESQDEIAKARESFAREQLSARKKFNEQWARLIRDQNQEIIDAEWEYQYEKENLLIEGDEKALADLETRYKHEKDVRGREHGDARDDLSASYDVQEAERQERFELQLKELDQRLKEEIANIRAEAEAETEAKKEALEEQLENEKEQLDDRLEKLGEALGEMIGDNEEATSIVLAMWETMYGAQVTAALTAGMATRADLQRTIDLALQAYQAVQIQRIVSGRRPQRKRVWDEETQSWVWEGHEGGYTPTGPINTLQGEFLSSPSTTSVLEGAVGGKLTQEKVRAMARKRLDVHMYGQGVPAQEIRALREELIRALKQEGMEY